MFASYKHDVGKYTQAGLDIEHMSRIRVRKHLDWFCGYALGLFGARVLRLSVAN
jgi:hypothetical protein